MEELNQIHRQYTEIHEKLNHLNEILSDMEDQKNEDEYMESLEQFTGFADRDMKNQLKKEEETLEQFTGFADRDMKNQLKKEEETLWALKRRIGEQRSKDIREAIREHDVLYGAIDQFVYGVRMQSEPDIMESAKSMLDHFPPHIEKVGEIARNETDLLQ